jgi:ribosomal protein S18 acetylase RimI-like enzyme
MDRDDELEVGDAMNLPYPHYRCPVDGEDLPLTEARITVTCAKHSPAASDTVFEVRSATDADRGGIEELCDRAWGETEVDAFGAVFDILRNDNILATVDGGLAGMVSLAVHGGELAIVLLSVYPEHQGAGIGKALLDVAAERAATRRLPFLKTVVSNDDISALYFFQRNGFVITDVALGALADRHGSAVPGFAGMPMRDELRLRRPVVGG